MIADSFREQPLRIRQSKDLFSKSVKLGFAQILRLWRNALNGSTTSDEPVRPLAPVSFFIVGGAVFKALYFVLLLCKLTLNVFFLGLQLLNFLFVSVKRGIRKSTRVEFCLRPCVLIQVRTSLRLPG